MGRRTSHAIDFTLNIRRENLPAAVTHQAKQLADQIWSADQ